MFGEPILREVFPNTRYWRRMRRLCVLACCLIIHTLIHPHSRRHPARWNDGDGFVDDVRGPIITNFLNCGSKLPRWLPTHMTYTACMARCAIYGMVRLF